MRGQAVSRLPSLGCLRDRILQNPHSRTSQASLQVNQERYYVNRNNGTSILNPGGDLTHTQSTFEEPLRTLRGWETMAQTEPAELDLKLTLETKDIFLYFGHGSGGQYVRPRTIKKLEKCAVALLMGCSSGALTEAGDFEPHGPPVDYMHAGSPAILATLWDVTDKDIDRFSQTVLTKWGLLKETPTQSNRSPIKKGASQKSKSKLEEDEMEVGKEGKSTSLDEVVPQGRDSCILKYLNGAAPILYGIPVYLSS